MTVAVGPRPEFFQNPHRLADGRIGEAVAERLRARALLLGIAGVPIVVVLYTREGGFFPIGQVWRGRVGRNDRHVQVDADAIGWVLDSDASSHRGAPVAALRR